MRLRVLLFGFTVGICGTNRSQCPGLAGYTVGHQRVPSDVVVRDAAGCAEIHLTEVLDRPAGLGQQAVDRHSRSLFRCQVRLNHPINVPRLALAIYESPAPTAGIPQDESG
jgi:hypothetical protein